MDPQNISLITTLILVFSAAILGGVVAKKLRQPMLLGYIVSGILFGNLAPRFSNQNFLSLIAQSGVTLLLFTLGVEFSFHRLGKIMLTSAKAVVLQILLVMGIFFALLFLIGFPSGAALFIATATALSSTAVVVRVLSERGELDTLPGELMTGWLVIQDLAVIPIMILLPAIVGLGAAANAGFFEASQVVFMSILQALVVLGIVIWFGRQIIPTVLNKVSGLKSREIFVLVTVGLVFLSALTTYALGLSAALGAFIAGLLVADTSQNHAIFSEIRPLRDLFASVFFVTLGMSLPFVYLLTSFWLLLFIAICLVLVKWFLVMGLTRYLGYHRKTAFLVAVGLTQMSEFGFIIASEGLGLGVLDISNYTFLIALTFLTILISVPMLARGHDLYYVFQKKLGNILPTFYKALENPKSLANEIQFRDHIILCGYGRVGRYIGRALEMSGLPFIAIDYDHTAVKSLRDKGIEVIYGDPADKSVLDLAQVDLAKALIIAIPDRHTQELIISNVHTLNRRISIICRTHHEEDQKILKALGVATVIQPEFEAAISIVQRLYADYGVPQAEMAGKISRLKIEHGLG